MGVMAHSLMMTLPILTLTLLQFANGKSIRFVAFFSALPMLFAVIYIIDEQSETPWRFLDSVFADVALPVLLPLSTLVLATGALGDELEDRTIAYLALKPVSRLRIAAEKYGAVVIGATTCLVAGMIATWLLAARSEVSDSADLVLALVVAILAGVLAYGSVFLFVSLFVPRALVVGILYTIIWEGLLSRPDLIPGAWVLSIRHYVLSLYTSVRGDGGVELDNAVQLGPALLVIAVFIAAGLLLSALRLRTMDLE